MPILCPLPPWRLAAQKQPEVLLAELKEGLCGSVLLFFLQAAVFFRRIRNKFSKNSFHAILPNVLARRNLTKESAGELLAVDGKVWQRICSGRYLPTKNLLFSLALAAGMSFDDLSEMMAACELALDYATVKDTVLAYLVTRGIQNREMIDAAIKEYKIENLFLK